MYQKILCSDMGADLDFDLDLLLDTSAQLAAGFMTPTTMIRMEKSLLNLDGTDDNDSDSGDSSLATDESNDVQLAELDDEEISPPCRKKPKVAAGTTSTGRPRQLPGPKSSRRIEDMTSEEIARRERRRDRNKAAAARCRQRRLDVTNQLLSETQQLEAEGQRLQREIENLRKQRDQLEFVLEAHQPVCHVREGSDDLFKFEHASVISDRESAAAVTPLSIMPVAVRPSSLPFSSSVAPTLNFGGFNLGSTGVTPVTSASGFNLFMGADANLLSPTTLLGSPSSFFL